MRNTFVPMSSHCLVAGPAGGPLDDDLFTFVRTGLALGERTVLMVDDEVWTTIADRLRAHGLDLGRAVAGQELVRLDAEDCLCRLSDRPGVRELDRLLAPRPSDGRPRRVLSLLTETAWRLGDSIRARAIERAWHHWLHANDAVVLCACRADVLDPAEDATALLELCRAHGMFHSALDNRQRHAIRDALDAVLGSRDASRLRSLVGRHAAPGATGADEELAVCWLRAEAPHLAHRVLAKVEVVGELALA
jgi:hypothetical protein